MNDPHFTVTHWGFMLSLPANTLSYKGVMLNLTARETQVMALILANPDIEIETDRIAKLVWLSGPSSRLASLRAVFASLRKKIKQLTPDTYIHKVDGGGERYIFCKIESTG